ncbi:MAG: hypothetical protein LBJ74_00840 [Heliobacteriaceae bacterium]|jgi:hypothetical protein|nr:hypothetical protein [Heliobacteriaceae bacterium]
MAIGKTQSVDSASSKKTLQKDICLGTSMLSGMVLGGALSKLLSAKTPKNPKLLIAKAALGAIGLGISIFLGNK